MYLTQQFAGTVLASFLFGIWQNSITAALFMAVFLTFIQFAVNPTSKS